MDGIAHGHYYQKQLGCRSGVIAWSHRSRFRMAARLVGTNAERVLDYGCGDGTFLATTADRFSAALGVDVTPDQIADCRTRLAGIPNLTFSLVGDLDPATHDGRYDVVTCMETLEHCVPPVVEVVLADLARLVSPAGRVIISVPIEIGPTFLIKAAVRRVAAWRGLSDYKYYERYTLPNALRMIFAIRGTALDRPTHGDPDAPAYSHYGFNWRALRERVRAHLTVERTLFSPLGFLGGWVSSQVWFVCRPFARADRQPTPTGDGPPPP